MWLASLALLARPHKGRKVRLFRHPWLLSRRSVSLRAWDGVGHPHGQTVLLQPSVEGGLPARFNRMLPGMGAWWPCGVPHSELMGRGLATATSALQGSPSSHPERLFSFVAVYPPDKCPPWYPPSGRTPQIVFLFSLSYADGWRHCSGRPPAAPLTGPIDTLLSFCCVCGVAGQGPENALGRNEQRDCVNETSGSARRRFTVPSVAIAGRSSPAPRKREGGTPCPDRHHGACATAAVTGAVGDLR